MSVRYGDACIVGGQDQDDATQLLSDLRERFSRVHCARHPDQTCRSAGGRWAHERRQRRGQGNPAPVDVLGCPHSCRETRTGQLAVRRHTVATRLRTKVQELKQTLRERRP